MYKQMGKLYFVNVSSSNKANSFISKLPSDSRDNLSRYKSGSYAQKCNLNCIFLDMKTSASQNQQIKIPTSWSKAILKTIWKYESTRQHCGMYIILNKVSGFFLFVQENKTQYFLFIIYSVFMWYLALYVITKHQSESKTVGQNNPDVLLPSTSTSVYKLCVCSCCSKGLNQNPAELWHRKKPVLLVHLAHHSGILRHQDCQGGHNQTHLKLSRSQTPFFTCSAYLCLQLSLRRAKQMHNQPSLFQNQSLNKGA